MKWSLMSVLHLHQGVDHLAGVGQIVLLEILRPALVAGLGQLRVDGQLGQQGDAVGLRGLGGVAGAEDAQLFPAVGGRCSS